MALHPRLEDGSWGFPNMLMNTLFFRTSPILQRVTEAHWRSNDERERDLHELRTSSPRMTDVLQLIWHHDAAVRQVAADLFVGRADAGATSMLFERALEHPAATRGYLSRIIHRIPFEILVKPLEDLVSSVIANRRRLGWDLAIALPNPYKVRYLERAIREAPAPLRAPALQQLLLERSPGHMLPLLLEMARDDVAQVGAVALEALSSLDAPAVLELMIQTLAHGDAAGRDRANAYLREAARVRPVELRLRLLELLGGGEERIRFACIELLFSTGEAPEVLASILSYIRMLVGWLRSRILETLGNLGRVAYEAALELLKHPAVHVRTAALALAEQKLDQRLLEPMCEMVHDPDWWLRLTACDLLGRLQHPDAIPHLVAALEDEQTRWAALEALGRIASPEALNALLPLSRDGSKMVRLEVVKAMAASPSAEMLRALERLALQDTAVEVRVRASIAVRTMAEALQIATSEIDPRVHEAVEHRLEHPLDRLLAKAREKRASDLHLTVGEPPLCRIDGHLHRMDDQGPLGASRIEEWLTSTLEPRHRERLNVVGEVDLCYSVEGVGRYRVNLYKQRLGVSASFRVIPNEPPTFAQLRLPGRLIEILDHQQGLIVVSGPAGSGKSTTLSALVNLVNESKAVHVITLEDPIEFVHPVKTALVNQREIGCHSVGFERALRAALREDPDVIVVGEMRDIETFRLALTAAETGHLVIATMHTTSAVQTIERLIKAFPPEEQPQVRVTLSESLKYVVCQRLIPRRDGRGRVAVYEVLKGVHSVSNLIRENKTHQLQNMIQLGHGVGMQTIDQALMDLVNSGSISAEDAWLRAERPDTFESLCSPTLLHEMRFLE